MTTATSVQLGVNGADPSLLAEVKPGRRIALGSCARSCCANDVVVRAAAFSIQIAAYDSFWSITNRSPDISCFVEDLEDPTQRIAVAPCRRDAVIPFEWSRIRCAGKSVLIVSSAEPKIDEAVSTICAADHSNRIDRRTLYFLALVALCADKLTLGPQAQASSTKAISEAILARGVVASPRSVRGYLENAARRLGLANQAGSHSRAWNRDQLATVAIVQGLVRPEDIRLLTTDAMSANPRLRLHADGPKNSS